jgi:hypothetical protein
LKLPSKILVALALCTIAVQAYAEKAVIKQMVAVRFVSALGSATAREGASWNAALTQDLIVDGKAYAHKDDQVVGTVLAVHPGTGPNARGTMQLRIPSINGLPVESGTVRRGVMGAASPTNPNTDALIKEGDVVSFYIISIS